MFYRFEQVFYRFDRCSIGHIKLSHVYELARHVFHLSVLHQPAQDINIVYNCLH